MALKSRINTCASQRVGVGYGVVCGVVVAVGVEVGVADVVGVALRVEVLELKMALVGFEPTT